MLGPRYGNRLTCNSLAFFTTMVNLIEQCELKPKEGTWIADISHSLFKSWFLTRVADMLSAADGTMETTKEEEPGSDGEERPEAEPKP